LGEPVLHSDGHLNLWTDALDWLLLPVNSYCSIRTNESTIYTSCAIVLYQDYVTISLQIDLVGQTETVLGTSGYAELTSFADLFGYCYFATYHREMPLSSMD
jgi:hypothetical protein